MHQLVTDKFTSFTDKKAKKIVFAMIEAGGGHKSPAVAVHDAMEQLFPGHYTLMLMDFMKGSGCIRLDTKHKQSWDFFLAHPGLCRTGELFAEISGPLFRFGLKQYLFPFYKCTCSFLSDQKPDLIFSTHPFNTIAFDQVRKRFGFSFILINYLTELFDASALWVLKDVDYFLVPTAEAKIRLVRKGVPADKLHVFNFPIRRSFFSKEERKKEDIAHTLGLNPYKKTLLMSIGGQGSSDLHKYIDVLMKEHLPLNIIACTGKNEEHRIVLTERYENIHSTVDIKVFGYTDKMHDLITCSDFCFIKPGPNTTIEAMALKKPMLFSRPVHGGEKANIKFAEAHRIGFGTNDSVSCFLAKMKILMNRQIYTEIVSNYKNITIKNGAEEIAQFISTLVETS